MARHTSRSTPRKGSSCAFVMSPQAGGGASSRNPGGHSSGGAAPRQSRRSGVRATSTSTAPACLPARPCSTSSAKGLTAALRAASALCKFRLSAIARPRGSAISPPSAAFSGSPMAPDVSKKSTAASSSADPRGRRRLSARLSQRPAHATLPDAGTAPNRSVHFQSLRPRRSRSSLDRHRRQTTPQRARVLEQPQWASTRCRTRSAVSDNARSPRPLRFFRGGRPFSRRRWGVAKLRSLPGVAWSGPPAASGAAASGDDVESSTSSTVATCRASSPDSSSSTSFFGVSTTSSAGVGGGWDAVAAAKKPSYSDGDCPSGA
mmetsp:Transcript_31626/g.107254  ORF Transcript_31626/g.107254 Transcript_31626/m.107254 type:complete len:319 (+) Transcript_31626:769-1725(+)